MVVDDDSKDIIHALIIELFVTDVNWLNRNLGR